MSNQTFRIKVVTICHVCGKIRFDSQPYSMSPKVQLISVKTVVIFEFI